MNSERKFYICPVCFRVCETDEECHQHQMVECHAGEPGDKRRKPLFNQKGKQVTRAPRWYLEAVGWIETD